MTLIQTRKMTKKMPVVLYGTEYWNSIINFQAMIDWGMIDREDMNIVRFADSPDDAFDYLKTELEKLL